MPGFVRRSEQQQGRSKILLEMAEAWQQLVEDVARREVERHHPMSVFHYECPETGLTVQVASASPARITEDGDIYLAVSCSCCGHTHNVDPESGRVFGNDSEKN
jgi:RNase P subunit RPR2